MLLCEPHGYQLLLCIYATTHFNSCPFCTISKNQQFWQLLSESFPPINEKGHSQINAARLFLPCYISLLSNHSTWASVSSHLVLRDVMQKGMLQLLGLWAALFSAGLSVSPICSSRHDKPLAIVLPFLPFLYHHGCNSWFKNIISSVCSIQIVCWEKLLDRNISMFKHEKHTRKHPATAQFTTLISCD